MVITPDASVTVMILTTVASVSGMLNMVFLKAVLGEIKTLRDSRDSQGRTLAVHGTDIDWIKRQINRDDDGDSGLRRRSHPHLEPRIQEGS